MQASTILIAADTYFPTINGAARFTNRLAHGLKDRGHEVHIICPDTTGKGKHSENEDGVLVHRVTSMPSFLYGDFRLSVPAIISKQVDQVLAKVQPDVIHTQCHYGVGRTVVKKANNLSIRIIGTNHFMPENVLHHIPLPGPTRTLATDFSWKDCGKIFRKCDIVTAPTPRAAHFLEVEGNVPKVWPISCGIDNKLYDIQPGEKIAGHKGKEILFVGRLDAEKNIDQLIKALRFIPESENIHLNIVGHGIEEKNLKTLVHDMLLENRVHFMGKISDEELRLAYITADVFCMPGTAELQSLATLEAMCAQTPIVAADAMALPHLVQEGKNGYLFEPGNIKDLADKLNKVLTASDDELKEMGHVSKEMTYKHSLDATLDKFERLYDGANNPN